MVLFRNSLPKDSAFAGICGRTIRRSTIFASVLQPSLLPSTLLAATKQLAGDRGRDCAITLFIATSLPSPSAASRCCSGRTCRHEASRFFTDFIPAAFLPCRCIAPGALWAPQTAMGAITSMVTLSSPYAIGWLKQAPTRSPSSSTTPPMWTGASALQLFRLVLTPLMVPSPPRWSRRHPTR